MILPSACLNNKSTPTTRESPELYVIFAALQTFVIPSLRKLSTLNSKGLGTKAGCDHCEVALYSPSIYLYLYAKHMNLVSK